MIFAAVVEGIKTEASVVISTVWFSTGTPLSATSSLTTAGSTASDLACGASTLSHGNDLLGSFGYWLAISPIEPKEWNYKNRGIKEWVNQSINQSMDQWINQWINQSINQSINRSMEELRNEWINVSMNQSTNQSMKGWRNGGMKNVYITGKQNRLTYKNRENQGDGR